MYFKKSKKKFRMQGQDFTGKNDIREKVQAKQDHKEIIVLKRDGDVRVLGTVTQRREHKTAGGEAEVRLASLKEPVLAKEPWETVCRGEKKLMLEEPVKILI